MSKAKLKSFRKIFIEKQNTIMKSLLKEEEIDGDGDEVDQIQGTLIHNIQKSLSMRDKETLNRINISLKKIDDGTFGSCDDCGETIPEARLLAAPGCLTCIICAEQQERLRKQFRI